MGGATANDVGSLGLNHLPGDAGEIANTATWAISPIAKGIGAAMRTADGLGTPAKTIADSMSVLQKQNNEAAADASRKLLETPKNITPDNFLSMKAKQLAQLRLGMGGGMAPGGSAPLLSSTALSGADPSKKKLLGQ